MEPAVDPTQSATGYSHQYHTPLGIVIDLWRADKSIILLNVNWTSNSNTSTKWCHVLVQKMSKQTTKILKISIATTMCIHLHGQGCKIIEGGLSMLKQWLLSIDFSSVLNLTYNLFNYNKQTAGKVITLFESLVYLQFEMFVLTKLVVVFISSSL